MAGGLKVGIVGAGGIARVAHVPGYRAAGVPIAAVCSRRADAAESIARDAGAPFWTTDYRRLLERDDIGAVSVCVPTYLHAEVTVAALRSGKHVLCEKPPALSAEEARAMEEAARAEKRILMYGFSVRFRAAHAALKRWIEAGELGRIYAARAGWMRRRGNPRGWFTEKARSGGGAMIDMGIHGLDLAWWLMGKPAPAAASGCTYREFGHYGTGDSATPDPVMQIHLAEKERGVFDVEDSAFAFVRFADGAHLMVEAAWALNCEQETRYVVLYGDRGGARIPPLAIYKDVHGGTVDLRPEVADNSPYLDEIRHFVSCVRGAEEPLVTPEDGTRIMTMVDAIYRSASSRREVPIGDG